jgi:general secretion pathway protein D
MKLTNKNPMKMRLPILILTMCFIYSTAYSQDRIPREYTNPEELISFDRQTPFQDAIEVIDQFAQEFEDRFIIDRTGYTGSIGLTLPPMHWRDALNYIARVQNLVIHEEPDLYEILTQQEAQARRAPEDTAVSATRAVAERIANTSTREVRINATFFEGSRRALREVGVDWSTLTNTVPTNLVDYVTEQGNERIPSSFDNRFVSVNAQGAQSVSQTVFNSLINFGDIGAGIEVQALFSAFEADNLGEVLATPSIKVMDGEEGRIQVGEDFSIKQRDFAGNVTDQFFSTGTILTVTPQIIDYEDTTFIYLDIDVERSSAQPDPVSTIISKEEASTHSLLIPGESTVIAGLYRTDRNEVRRGIPILKDLPGWFFGLKYLFGYNQTDVSQSELIVIVQAELEETIPQRMARQLRSNQQVLEAQQARHREHMDYISGEAFQSSFFEEPAAEQEINLEGNESSVDDSSEYEPNGDPEPEARLDDVREPQTDSQEQELLVSELQQQEVQEIARESRSVDMQNVNKSYSDLKYYTVGGSFRDRERAQQFYQKLQQEGYGAHLLYQPRSGFYFVAYDGFENLEQAIRFTRQVQDDVQHDAWLSTIVSEDRLELSSTSR